MLKRFIAALSLLAFCITICISSYVIVNKLTDNINQHLEQALELIEQGNTENATVQISKSEEKWEKYQKTFNIFLDHSMLEDLNVDLPSIKPLLKSGSTDTAKEKIEDCINALENIIDEQKLSIGNIL